MSEAQDLSEIEEDDQEDQENGRKRKVWPYTGYITFFSPLIQRPAPKKAAKPSSSRAKKQEIENYDDDE